jgi:adenylate cyclase
MAQSDTARGFGERKLAAVMACDVVGYTRLMSADEQDTLVRFKSHVDRVIRPQIEGKGGRIVKLMGDGVLAEFPSVVDCVRSAIAMQEQLAALNASEEPARRMDLRVGINAGDIVVDKDDIFGDSVNVAARLEGIADAGGIAISDAVAAQLKGRLQVDLEPRGEVQFKNLPSPVRVWRVRGMTGVTPPAASLAMPDKPCIAILPFAVMGASDDHDALADGLTEDITTALSRIHSLFVIARNSAFTYKGRAVDIKQVARELGVQYVLEGSVRKAGNRLRITAQLIDALSGTHVWAEKYDREHVDIFDLQDEITRNVAATIQTEVTIFEGERRRLSSARDLRLNDLLKIAWRETYRLSREGFAVAHDAIGKARAIDPDHPEVLRVLATIQFHEAYLGLVEDPANAREGALHNARRAVELHDANEYAHWIYGTGLIFFNKFDEAISQLRRAIELNPNCSLAYGSLGTVLMWAGQGEESIRNNEIALRSNPRDPSNFFRYFGLAGAYFQIERYEDCLRWARQAAQQKPEWLMPRLFLASALGHLGQLQEAANAYRAIENMAKGRLEASIDELPFRKEEDRARLRAGLMKAHP